MPLAYKNLISFTRYFWKNLKYVICNPTHPTFSHLQHNTEKYFFSAYAYSLKHVTVM